MREICMLRSTRRGLETWHGRDGVTLAAAEDAGANALRTAASRFLKKPFSDERLIDCLGRALIDPASNTRQS